MDLEAASSGSMSKKKAPKGAFHGPAGGSFTQKKKVILGNVKHSGDEQDISLKSGSNYSAFSDVKSLSSDENDINMSGGGNGSLLSSAVNTLRANRLSTGMDFGSPLSFPTLPWIKSKWVDPIIIKTQVEVPVKKSFALDINLSAIEGKSENMRKAASLAKKEEIIVNNNVRKQGLCSDWAVVIKEILMDMSKDMIIAAVSEFGIIKSIKIQLVGTTVHDLGTLLDGAEGKTCVINRLLETGNQFCCAVVCFESDEILESAFHTEPIFGSVQLLWARLKLVQCGRCGHFGHSALKCNASDVSSPVPPNLTKRSSFGASHLQLAKLYAKKNVLISHPAVFGGKSWAQVVSFVSPPGGSPSGSGLLSDGASPLFSSFCHQVNGLGDRLTVLE
ncbi:hypothetical protein G9A89_017211 [Geosiphon pyriformis]|nr:hypothetical protein G9A89_017211 [Geosiphon pyriformis]